MITTRTRALSILATVAMLVSMLACFVIPASADDALIAPYRAVIADAESGTDALAAEIENADATEDSLKAAAASVVLKSDIKPRYAYAAAYAAAGYTGTDYAITLAADWAAMRDVADVATADYFAGYTFHLTNDVEFDSKTALDPMGKTTTTTAGFAGTIDGHGYGFNNIYVTCKTKYGDAHVVSGLFQRLSNCTFRDFGINSGAFAQTSSNNAGSTSTFGPVISGKTPTFERVWSGAIIAPVCNAQGSGLVGTFSHTDISVNVNGFVFDGTLLKGGNDNHNYQHSFGVMGTYNSTIADGDDFYNIITDFDSVNGAGFGVDSNGEFIYTRSENQRVQSALFTFSSEDTYAASTIKNVYAVKRAADSITAGYFVGKATGTTGASSASLLTEMSAVEAAYTINNNPTNGVGETPVYFTLKNGKVRPVATNANAIVKLTLTGYKDKAVYINNGTTLTLADLAKELDVDAAAITAVTVDGEPLDGTSYVVDGDATIAITVSKSKLLADVLAKYAALETKYLTEAAATALTEFRAAAADAGEDNDKIQAVLDSEATMKAALAVTDVIANLPEYTKYDTYAAYNTANAWLIKTSADWLAMVEDSDGTGVDFAGMTFHLVDHVTFSGAMKPLCAKGAFKGTIDGHGYGFDNVLINKNTIGTDYAYVGLIYNMIAGSVKDFGINSGRIDCSETDISAYTGGLFGAIDTAQVTTDILIQNCWNGADVYTAMGGSAKSGAAMAGYIKNNSGNNEYLVINGFLNTGDIISSTTNTTAEIYTSVIQSTSCLHYNNGIFNSLNGGTISNSNTVGGPCFMRLNAGLAGKAVNNASVGDLEFKTYGTANTEICTIEYYNGFETLEEAAYKLNQGSTGLTTRKGAAVDAVYYTITDKGIRPTGTEANQIIKYSISINGGEAYDVFYNAGEITMDQLGLEVGDGVSYKINDVDVVDAKATVTDDALVDVTYDTTALCAMAQKELDTYIAKYSKYSVDLMANDTLATFKAAVEAAKAIEEINADKLAALEAAVAAGKLVNIELKLEWPAYPAYSDYDLYKEFNPDNHWAIKTADDWKKMAKYADTSTEKNAKNQPAYFVGYTFHLVDDVDFSEAGTLSPTGFGKYFDGTINGHGFGFDDITLKDTNPADNGTMDSYPGIFFRLGAANFVDFGVNSGTYTKSNGGGASGITTFGNFKDGAGGTPTFTRVWSGLTLSHQGGGASVTVGALAEESQDSGAVVNGFYFYGKLISRSNSANGGITGRNSRGYKFYNIISAPVDVSPLDYMVQAYRTDLLADTNGMDGTVGNYLTDTMNNVYGIGYTQAYYYRTTDAITAPATNVIEADNARLLASSVEEAAWKINANPITGKEVYYSFNADGDIRPVATDAKAIAKVIVGGEAAEKVLYRNKTTVIDLVNDLGVNLDDPLTKVDINGTVYTGDQLAGIATITLSDVTTTISVDYDLSTQMNEVVDAFKDLDVKYLTNGDELTALRSARDAAITSGLDADMQAVIDTAKAYTPKVVTDYEKLPSYSLYDIYAPYNEGNNWLIDSADTWRAMVAESMADTNITYAGLNFHLAEDIDFGGVAMAPLCYGGIFKGSIYGHGFGFTDILLDSTTLTKSGADVGLISVMQNGTLENFGINSGLVDASTHTESVRTGGIIGQIAVPAAADNIVIKKVWNGADVAGAKCRYYDVGALAGFITNSDGNNRLTINGFINTGDLTTNSVKTGSDEHYPGVIHSGGAYYYVSPITNVLHVGKITFNDTNYAPSDELTAGTGAMLLRIRADKGPSILNNATVSDNGELAVLRINMNGGDFKTYQQAPTHFTMAQYESGEIGYILNQNSGSLVDGKNGDAPIDPVYFSLKNGKIAFGADDGSNQIVKAEVSGEGITAKTLYVNANEPISMADFGAMIGVAAGDISGVTVNGDAAGENVVLTDDATVVVSLRVCEHANLGHEPIDGNTHKVVCQDCSFYSYTEDCDGTWVAGNVNMEDGTSVHTKTCSKCGDHSVACNGTRTTNPANCTEDAKWVFTCGIHAAEHVITGSGAKEHIFSGDWTAAGDKEYRTCENCSSKEYRTCGKVDATIGTDVKVHAGGSVNVSVTLGVALTEATLTLTPSEGFTIVGVFGEGITWTEGNTATAANTAEGAVVTVTLKADALNVTGNGTLKVDITNASNAEGEVTNATSTATLVFEAELGNANGDNKINLIDALLTLYSTVGNAEVNTANADMDADGDVDIYDVYAIVRVWLKTLD